MLKITRLHRVKITQAGPGAYSVSGAVTLPAAFNPMRAAAIALIADGRDPADKLVGVFEGAAISPVALARLAAPYSPPRINHRLPGAGRNLDA
jgi:hypothetical protein